MSDSTNALVLPVDSTSSSEAKTFPGFPGVYRPGVPVLLSTIGLDLMDARASIEELGLPLVEHAHDGDEEPAVPDANPPRAESRQPFGDALGAPEPPSSSEPADNPPALEKLTKVELVAHAAALDPPLELDEALKKDEMLDAIAQHGLPPATTPPPQPPIEAGVTPDANAGGAS